MKVHTAALLVIVDVDLVFTVIVDLSRLGFSRFRLSLDSRIVTVHAYLVLFR